MSRRHLATLGAIWGASFMLIEIGLRDLEPASLMLGRVAVASRGDPKSYLDDLRRRMDEIAAQSPEMPDRDRARAQSRHGLAKRASPRSPSLPSRPDADLTGAASVST